MIDDMVALLAKDQSDDETQKVFCEDEFEKAGDEDKAAKEKAAGLAAAIEESSDALDSLADEIATLAQGVKDLDKAVAQATEQRKEEHEDYLTNAQLSEAAMQLLEKAKNRMQKFYNPTLYKAPPKTENTMEGKIIEAGTFVQVRSHVAPPPPPETFGEYKKSGEKSAGVIGMMDTIIKDLGNDMKDAEYEEKTAQKDYAELMAESQATRAADTKALTGKKSTKAEVEGKLMTSKETRAATSQDLKLVQTAIKELHVSCDFILENHGLRLEARTNEIES